MFAHIMLFNEKRIHRKFWIHLICNKCHFSALFHYFCIINSIVWRCSPREWPMVLNQNCRCMVWVNLADVKEFVNNHISCFQFIFNMSYNQIAQKVCKSIIFNRIICSRVVKGANLVIFKIGHSLVIDIYIVT